MNGRLQTRQSFQALKGKVDARPIFLEAAASNYLPLSGQSMLGVVRMPAYGGVSTLFLPPPAHAF
jgi:hypothetical protein